MADNKQYIKQMQENGSVQISEDVIAAIVVHAVSEVKGIVGVNGKPGADVMEMVGKKGRNKGVKITVSAKGSISIDCNITVTYGTNVVTIGKTAQTAIINALEPLAEIKIDAVNVNVCGIVRQ